jgi:hypothetical protein
LARLQADLLGGIDLPDVVGLQRPVAVGGAAAAGAGGGQAGVLEPALQGADPGHDAAGVLALHHDAEQARAPGGMLPP